ncbi:MAG: hydantoinase/oxoprolinase family protein [Geminicoccaceae bacterium]|nr:hydantoinase/oxoprolinase family protein [Geminicoccaceae bacterium]
MKARLGIDTGGTYTDAVILSSDGELLASSKSVTTRHDLAIGIRNAVSAVLQGRDVEIELVGLSTTLATNAIVEGRGGRVGLLLAGFEADLIRRAGLSTALGSDPVALLEGGHDAHGVERRPLDTVAARRHIAEMARSVDAFAITSRFAVRNPEHERTLAAVVAEICDRPCTMGHELSARLDAPRRALTTVLNARLIPEITRLLDATQSLLEQFSIRASLMVVRGDGSLMRADAVRLRPVETILSGPAASVVGTARLAGSSAGDTLVADVGGTTTDIALLENGRPRIDPRGAMVGGFRTMVEAIELRTSGLGGDSAVDRDDERQLTLGPRRDMPLSLLAEQYPETLLEMQKQAERPLPRALDARFAMLANPVSGTLSRSQRQLVELLDAGPRSMEEIVDRDHLHIPLKRMVERGHVLLAGFTPSDAAHLLGSQRTWSRAAATLGATLEGRKGRRQAPLGETGEDFARAVLNLARKRTARALMDLASGEESPRWLDLPAIDRALDPEPEGEYRFETRLTLGLPVIAVGGPAPIFYPQATDRLSTTLTIPRHHVVCNAIGAVTGDVIRHAETTILQVAEDRYAVQIGNDRFETTDAEVAVEHARAALARMVRAAFSESGGVDADIAFERDDRKAMIDTGREMIVEIRLRAVASGRPAIT